jgi:hypothetical protein
MCLQLKEKHKNILKSRKVKIAKDQDELRTENIFFQEALFATKFLKLIIQSER